MAWGDLAPDQMPLFLESGKQAVPADALPTDPNERAALIMSRAVRPPMGRGEVETRPAQMLAAIPAAMAPGAALKVATSFPRITAGLLGALGLTSATEAGEEQFKWDDPNREREAAIAKLNRDIEVETSRRTPSAPGTQKLRIEGLTKQRDDLLSERSQERNAAFAVWQQAQSEKINAERPFRQEYPNLYRALPLAGWAGSTVGGLLGAKAGAPIKSFLGGALGGVPLSAAAAIGPTAYDAATLPTGSKYQAEAAGWLRDLDNYWLGRVAPEIAVGGLLGGTAAKYGSQVGDRAKQLFQRRPAAAPAIQGSVPPQAAPPVSPAPGAKVDYRDAYWDSSGRLRVGGRYVPTSSPMSLAPY